MSPRPGGSRVCPAGTCAAVRLTLALATCVFGAACDNTPARTEAHYDVELPQPEPQGPHYEDADFELNAGPPVSCAASGVLAPAAGLTRWAIPVDITTRSQRHVPSGPMLFSLLMNGQVHRPILASCKAPFAARQLKPGERVAAYVVFDLPPISPPLKLNYEPFIIGRQPVKAQVLVPQGAD